MNENAVDIPRRSTLARALTLGATASVVAGALIMASRVLAAATTDFGGWRWRAMVAGDGSSGAGLVCLAGVVMWLVAAWLEGRAPTRPVGMLAVGVAGVGLVVAILAVLAILTQTADGDAIVGLSGMELMYTSIPWEERISRALGQATGIALLAPVPVLAWPLVTSAGRSGTDLGHVAKQR